MTTKVVRLRQALEITGLSRSAFYEKLRPTSKYFDADLPQPFKLSARSVGWLESALEEWVHRRSAKRN